MVCDECHNRNGYCEKCAEREGKSYVTLLVCPDCGKNTGSLALDKRLRKTFNKTTKDITPCDECMKKYVILFDADSLKYIGLALKDTIIKPDVIENYRDTPVKLLVRKKGDGYTPVSEEEKNRIMQRENRKNEKGG